MMEEEEEEEEEEPRVFKTRSGSFPAATSAKIRFKRSTFSSSSVPLAPDVFVVVVLPVMLLVLEVKPREAKGATVARTGPGPPAV